jgi:hypothetical protein
MDSMGEGLPSLLESASARMAGGRVVTGKAIWERKPMRKSVVRAILDWARKEAQSEEAATATAVTIPCEWPVAPGG